MKYSRSWSGFGGLHRNKKRKKKVWHALYGRAGLAKRRSVISITDAGEMPVYSHSQEKQCWTGMGRMLSRFWQWLEYDPVALAVLLIGVGSIAVLVLGI
jgi:hypothetical protein